jgi:hypothetical protein
MKKALIYSFLVLLLFSKQGISQAVLLNVPVNTQQTWTTCWTAVSLSILQYYGHNNCTQNSIFQWAAPGPDSMEDLYTVPGDGNIDHAVDSILSHFGSIATTPFATYLSFSDSKSLLSNDKPFIIRWTYDSYGSSGHFIIAIGYQGSGVYYIDPMYNAIQFQGYDWMVASDQHSWWNTLRLNTTPPYLPYEIANFGTMSKIIPAITIINSLLLKPYQ